MSPEAIIAPVRRQLDAYNARGIESFMQCWAEDCEYFAFPNELLARGVAAVRARHVERFRETPLHGALIHRMVVGNLVIDQEIVTRNFPEGLGEADVLAIHEVVDGRIVRGWYKTGTPRLLPRSD